ncbi:MAG: GNAT family N-acetyltransferase [Chloroflexi bacterium]|nr:GNAT family N-acetyltransferase [Chloroflexota bacterium]
MTITVRRLQRPAELGWAEEVLEHELAGRMQARRGELVDALEGEEFVAEVDGALAGLITFHVTSTGSAPEAEVRCLVVAAAARKRGVGSALLDAVIGELRVEGVRRAWLATTNDNLGALGFFQRHGWRLSALRPGAVDEGRRSLNPSIGEVAANGIPIRDELELTLDV